MKEKKHKPTIKDVAKLAKVSLSTASLVLNNKKGVKDETKQKVLDAARDLHFRVNASARILRASDSKIIGLILPDVTNVYYSKILEKVRRLIEEHGYFLLIGITGNKLENEIRCVSEFISRGVDGVIVIPMLRYVRDTSHIDQFAASGIPVIFLSAEYPGMDFMCVMCNLMKGSYEMTRYLLDKNLRDIVLITNDEVVDNDYIMGYKMALQLNGIPYRNENIYECEITFDDSYETSKKVLANKPQAIMTISDLMACAATQAARTQGLQIPQDISITGYDDVLYSWINQTPITTVHQPIEEMCERSVGLLFEMIESGTQLVGKELLNPHIVKRETTL